MMKCSRNNCLCFLSDHFCQNCKQNYTSTMFSCNGSIFLKMMTSQVTQVTWLIGQSINPSNLHVSRNLSILIVVLAELEEKTKLTIYWPVYELVDDITTTSYHSHIELLKILQKSNVVT